MNGAGAGGGSCRGGGAGAGRRRGDHRRIPCKPVGVPHLDEQPMGRTKAGRVGVCPVRHSKKSSCFEHVHGPWQPLPLPPGQVHSCAVLRCFPRARSARTHPADHSGVTLVRTNRRRRPRRPFGAFAPGFPSMGSRCPAETMLRAVVASTMAHDGRKSTECRYG